MELLTPRPILKPATRAKREEQQQAQRRREDDKKKRADEMAREALGLKPGQPAPKPVLTPELDEALDTLPKQDRSMVETVLGCTQEMTRRVELARKAAQDEAGASAAATKRTSFTQQLMVRRADDGSMTEQDVERARGIVETQGARGWINPTTSGADALFQQSQDMLRANQRLVEQLTDGPQNKGTSFVIQSVEQDAGLLANVVRDHQATLQVSDLARLRQVVVARDAVRHEGVANGISGP